MSDELQLALMRHAKAETGGASDYRRALSGRGRRDAARMGEWLATAGFSPERIVASPALRARQTAELLCEAASLDAGKISWEEALYNADPQTLLMAARENMAASARVMLIGHNPAMSELMYYLSADTPPRTDDGKEMTTANIAILKFTGERARTLEPNTGELVTLMRPGDLPKK